MFFKFPSKVFGIDNRDQIKIFENYCVERYEDFHQIILKISFIPFFEQFLNPLISIQKTKVFESKIEVKFESFQQPRHKPIYYCKNIHSWTPRITLFNSQRKK